MTEIEILNESVENILNIDKTFDLIYMDPPFGLQRDFKMLESMVMKKGFLIIGTLLMIILIGMLM